jgi:glutamate-5-semialdehyde dehydrogenase
MDFSIHHAAKQAKAASRQVAQLTSEQKTQALLSVADALIAATPDIITANQRDLDNAVANNMDAAMQDRLALDAERIAAIAQAVRNIAQQPEVVGHLSEPQTMPSGISVQKMRIPLGVIGMIYESRPNVTIDAAALCFKAGNAVILRGGKEALHSNLALAKCLHQAFAEHGIDSAAVTVIPDPDREILNTMLTLADDIDLIIPRGGEGLIRFVSQTSQIPVIQHFKGVCHLYIDEFADHDKAILLLENGKTQRTSVCNSLETVLIHRAVAADLLPRIAQMFAKHNVVVHACEASLPYFVQGDDSVQATLATDADWEAEYLAMEIAVRVVDDFDQGIAHIQTYNSGHTEVIVSEDPARQQAFLQQVHSAVVMINASSRFSDGGELGLGAEIGISTSKLHAYGPMGAESLTTQKFVVTGQGQIRT